MKFAAAFSAIAISIAAPNALFAQDTNKVSSSTEELTVGSNKEKVICRRDKVVGSRLKSERICKTAQEWQRERQLQREHVERGQNQRTASAGA